MRERFLNPTAFGLYLLGFAYCFFHYAMGGFLWAHLIFALLVVALYLMGAGIRFFLLLALPLVLKEIIFDSLRYVPFDWLKPIHILEPYTVDRSWFGMVCGGALKPINECLLLFKNSFIDLLFGISYHVLEPINYLVLFLLWKKASLGEAQKFAASFLAINLMAFLTYVFYPAAAPWYAAHYGFVQPVFPVTGNPAGLIHFDHLIGISLSQKIYGASPVVFGAIPSMHAGFVFLEWFYLMKMGRRWGAAGGVYLLLMSFAALYLQHHYVIDILLGGAYAFIAFGVIEFWLTDFVRGFYRALFVWLEAPEGPPLAPEPSFANEGEGKAP